MRVVVAFVIGLAAALTPIAVSAGASHLDTSFAAGFVVEDLRDTRDKVTGVAVRPTGEIVVGASSRRPSLFLEDPGFLQLTSTGEPDTSFGDGGDGRQIVVLPEASQLLDMALTTDGKIVGVARGTTTNYLFRLNADGSLDTVTDSDPTTFFDTDGIVQVDFGANAENWWKVAVQPSGMVVVAGWLRPGATGPAETAVARYSATGAFDGQLSMTIGSAAIGSTSRDLAISPSGDRIAISNTARNASDRGIIAIWMLDGDTLDPDFTYGGGDAIATAGLANTDVDGHGLAFASDGKVVASGEFGPPLGREPMLVRFKADGLKDPTFDGNGIAQPDLTDFAGVVRSLQITATGKVLVFSGGTGDSAGARLRANGSVDTTFGGDGSIAMSPDSFFELQDAALMSGGAVIAVGNGGQSPDVLVAKLTSRGAPDRAFRAGGAARYSFGSTQDREIARAIAVTPSGKLLLAGVTDFSNFDQFWLLRLLPDGQRDDSFGTGGWARADFINASAWDMAMRGNKAVVVGHCKCGTATDHVAVARFTGSGVLDTTFGGGDGQVEIDFGSGGPEFAFAVAIQDDGRIVVAGEAGGDFALARLTSSGALDGSFGTGGKVLTDIGAGTNDSILDVAVQSNGRIVAAGSRLGAGQDSRFALARYQIDGDLDPTFSGDGKQVTKMGSVSSSVSGIAIRPDGRIIAAGRAFDGSVISVALARYGTNGALDSSFDGDGKRVALLDPFDDAARDVLAVGNKIVVSGVHGDGDSWFVARFLGGGALDTTFSGVGYEYTDLGSDDDSPSGLAIQPSDGRIVVSGTSDDGDEGYDFAIARYDP